MTYKLTDLKMFADIQAQLDTVTAADLAALSPGDPLPEGAVIVGDMPPTLKAINWIRDEKVATFNRAVADLGNVGSWVTAQDYTKMNLRALEQRAEAEFYMNLSISLFRCEYPETAFQPYGFGPEFQVYILRTRA